MTPSTVPVPYTGRGWRWFTRVFLTAVTVALGTVAAVLSGHQPDRALLAGMAAGMALLAAIAIRTGKPVTSGNGD